MWGGTVPSTTQHSVRRIQLQHHQGLKQGAQEASPEFKHAQSAQKYPQQMRLAKETTCAVHTFFTFSIYQVKITKRKFFLPLTGKTLFSTKYEHYTCFLQNVQATCKSIQMIKKILSWSHLSQTRTYMHRPWLGLLCGGTLYPLFTMSWFGERDKRLWHFLFIPKDEHKTAWDIHRVGWTMDISLFTYWVLCREVT